MERLKPFILLCQQNKKKCNLAISNVYISVLEMYANGCIFNNNATFAYLNKTV